MAFLRVACQCLLLVLPAVLCAVPPENPLLQNVEPKLGAKATEIVLYKDKDDKRMVEVFYDKLPSGKDYMVDCFVMGDKVVSKELLISFPPQRIVVLPKAQLEDIINECSAVLLTQLEEGRFHPLTSGTRGLLDKGAFNTLVIYPGTKWCGAGNVASDYDDLGSSEETDKCCREHDHCYDSIASGETKYDLKNKALYTKSHCDCDRTFTSCLKATNVKASNTVGGLYFNTLQVQCFESNHPIVKCVDYSGWLPGIFWSCQKYEFDTTKSPIWQFFDAKRY